MEFTESDEETPSNFNKMGYESLNIIDNLGLLFVMLALLIIISIAIVLMKRLCFKCSL